MGSENTDTDEMKQFTLWQIMGLWLSATVPMAVMVFGVAPELIARLNFDAGLIYWACVIVGMYVQMIVAILVLIAEGQVWTWARLRKRLWLTMPRHPKKTRAVPWALVTWTLFGALLCAAISELFYPILDIPFSATLADWMSPDYASITALATPENAGRWLLVGFAMISSFFNYVIGEALLFHCILLPRMIGVFGRQAWAANGVLLGLYHVHKLAFLPTAILASLPFAFPAQRYKSSLLAILMHGVEGIILIIAVLVVVTGSGL
ncbi:MAG: hypothetical protein AAGA08_20560 [Pseudomonadota bacterium]